jgi:hypothetical protein
MRNDVQFSVIKRVFVAMVVIVAVIQTGVWFFYRYLRADDQRRDVRRSLVESTPPIPPRPRLEVDPTADFQEYLHGQKQILKSYGWVSRTDGRVHIPIDRAMELVVEKEKQ